MLPSDRIVRPTKSFYCLFLHAILREDRSEYLRIRCVMIWKRENEREISALVNDKNKQTKRKRRALRGDKFGLESQRDVCGRSRERERTKKKKKSKRRARARERDMHTFFLRVLRFYRWTRSDPSSFEFRVGLFHSSFLVRLSLSFLEDDDRERMREWEREREIGVLAVWTR